jgi:hypothetical protein
MLSWKKSATASETALHRASETPTSLSRSNVARESKTLPVKGGHSSPALPARQPTNQRANKPTSQRANEPTNSSSNSNNSNNDDVNNDNVDNDNFNDNDINWQPREEVCSGPTGRPHPACNPPVQRPHTTTHPSPLTFVHKPHK